MESFLYLELLAYVLMQKMVIISCVVSSDFVVGLILKGRAPKILLFNKLSDDLFSLQQSSSPVEVGQDAGPQIDPNPLPLPPVPHEVMRTASERHQKGLMCPWIYQVLTQVCI